MTAPPPTCACRATGTAPCADWCGRNPGQGRIVGIFLDPPMAIARVGRSPEPMDAYRWIIDENPHRGVQTRIEPTPSLHLESVSGDGYWPYRLKVVTPDRITFKDRKGRVRPVAPFFELWAQVQDPDGSVIAVPVTRSFLQARGARLADLVFTVDAANRKAQSRTKLASCAAVAHVTFPADNYRPHRLDAISPRTRDQVPLVRPDAPLPLGTVQTFLPGDGADCRTRLDQIRLRFTPGKGDAFGPPDADVATASPRPPGDFEPAVTEYGLNHRMTRPENRILTPGTAWSGFNFRTGGTPKWPTPQDSYDGAREGSGDGWGTIDDTCDLILGVALTVGGRVLTAKARAFAGPPDFAPDRRPMYSIRDELDDRELPPAVPDPATTPDEILDLFRRIFETASLVNLDQRRAWALAGNAGILGGSGPDDPDWDDGLSPRLGPKSMRAADAPYAELAPDYTPEAGDTRVSVPAGSERLPFTQVVQQIHARMADSPILREFLARRPDRVRRIVRPPFARLADLPRRTGVQPPAAVPVGKWDLPPDQGGTPRRPAEGDPPRYRDPRNVMDQTYDMRMPPYMRHSMGVPLSITRRQYDLLMAYLDRLETDPRWRADPKPPAAQDDHD
ncbi:MAG: hypothetical protein LPJ95_08090 [Paracoccaceae bacterium]|nr:hypothetical protein [Paracoccaceae bacterium]